MSEVFTEIFGWSVILLLTPMTVWSWSKAIEQWRTR